MHNMKRMKIRIENDGGYKGLTRAKFPLVLEATVEYSGLCSCAILEDDGSAGVVLGRDRCTRRGRLCFLSSRI